MEIKKKNKKESLVKQVRHIDQNWKSKNTQQSLLANRN
jgi:hypothetical protein